MNKPIRLEMSFCLKAIINVSARAKKDSDIGFGRREFDEV
jgi:hypothetical protein